MRNPAINNTFTLVSFFAGDLQECGEAADRQTKQAINPNIESDYEREPIPNGKKHVFSTGTNTTTLLPIDILLLSLYLEAPPGPSTSLASVPFKGNNPSLARRILTLPAEPSLRTMLETASRWQSFNLSGEE